MPKQKKKRAATSKPYAATRKENNDDPSDTSENQNSESLHCGVCTTGVDYLIQCEKCDIWYCHICAKVPEQLIELLVDCNEAHWFCQNCNPIAVEAICNLSKTNSETTVTETLDKALKQFNDIVIETKNELKKSFSEVLQQRSLDNDMDTSNYPTNKPKVADPNKHNIVDAVDEYVDRERRKCNLIVYGLPESPEPATKESGSKDARDFQDLVKDMKVKNVQVTKMT